MKRIASLLICAAIIASMPSLAISGPSRFVIGLQGGMFMPQNDQADNQLSIFGNWNGLGSTDDISGYLGYYFSDIEMRLESGYRRDKFQAEIWNNTRSLNTFKIIPFELSAIYHSKYFIGKIEPYIGIGAGIYWVKWNTGIIKSLQNDPHGDFLQVIDPVAAQSYEDKAIGAHLIAGAEWNLVSKIFLSGDIKFTRVSANWQIKYTVQPAPWGGDLYTVRDRIKITIGGTSMRFGIGYRF